jgi:hypothetical protein
METTLKNRPDNHGGFDFLFLITVLLGGGVIYLLYNNKSVTLLFEQKKSTPEVNTNGHSEPAPTIAPSTELRSGFTFVANSVGNRSYT